MLGVLGWEEPRLGLHFRRSGFPRRRWVVGNETRSVIQERNGEAMLGLFPLPIPGSPSPVPIGVIFHTIWPVESISIRCQTGSEALDQEIYPWLEPCGWERRRHSQVFIVEVPNLSSPLPQDRIGQFRFPQVMDFLGEGKSEHLRLGELHHLSC